MSRTGPSLSRVTTKSETLPDRIIVYAPTGWGKTTFAAGFPGTVFLMTPGEDRLKKLIAHGFVPPTAHFPEIALTWAEVNDAVNELIDLPHDYKTLVIDTGNGAEQLAQHYVCQTNYNGDWGPFGFNQFAAGEKETANRVWEPFLRLLDRLRECRRMRVVLCCHTVARTFRNPEADYDKTEPGMSKSSWAATAKWADMILYGKFKIEVKKESKIARGKATGGRDRLLITSPTAAHEAKNCYGLPAEINLGQDPARAFSVFRAAFKVKSEHPTEAAANGQAPNGRH